MSKVNTQDTETKPRKKRAPKKLGYNEIIPHVQNLTLEEKLKLKNGLNDDIQIHKEQLQKQLELIK